MASCEIESRGPSPKKVKLDIEADAKDNQNNQDNEILKDLANFKPEKILSNNSNRKVVCVQGSFLGKDGIALVLLEKTAFADSQLTNDETGYFTDQSILKYIFKNDIYSSYQCLPEATLNGLKTTVIYPATEKHLRKYTPQNVHLIDETAELYNTVTLPHLEKEQFTLDWVYNILSHKSEADRIVFEDKDPETGFVLLPDLKWDGKTLETLYLIAITHKKGLKSLRDLNESHLPLLKNIHDKGIQAIEEKYKIPGSQLRIYFHYQPSFYHLHAHFTYLKYEAPGIFTEKSHMLSNVVSNIEILSDYYQKVTIPFTIRETDNLFKKYEEKGIVKKTQIK